jgi:mRNA interferase MazF
MMSIRRGEVYFVNLSPVQGREQSGSRPVLVVSRDSINDKPLVITVVVGTRGANVTRDYATNVRVSAEESGLPDETVFLCFQVRSLDPRRFPSRGSGHLSADAMGRIEQAVRYCLDLSERTQP